jgi:hypothetical protein
MSERRFPTPVNVRNFSVRCGRCGHYQVLAGYARLDDDWNVYTYECDQPPCIEDLAASRTLIEVPIDLDEFANRDPKWRGGRIHGGAEPVDAEPADAEPGDAEPDSETQ